MQISRIDIDPMAGKIRFGFSNHAEHVFKTDMFVHSTRSPIDETIIKLGLQWRMDIDAKEIDRALDLIGSYHHKSRFTRDQRSFSRQPDGSYIEGKVIQGQFKTLDEINAAINLVNALETAAIESCGRGRLPDPQLHISFRPVLVLPISPSLN
jgi:hypothetical protein